jgi:hypothetical protein
VFESHSTTWTVHFPLSTLHRITITSTIALPAATVPVQLRPYNPKLEKRDTSDDDDDDDEERLVGSYS